MVNQPLNLQYVFTRRRFLEKRKSIDENYVHENIPTVGTNPDSYKYRVEKYIRENSHDFISILNLLESLYSDNNFEVLEMSTICTINEVIPMIESSNLGNCIELIKKKNIGEINEDRLLEAAKLYKSIDRIENNHKSISKRFTLADHKHKSDKDFCYKLCEMVDTYNTSRYIKFNIALEELCYLGSINGKEINESSIVKNVLDYFLMINENTANDIDSYKKAINVSKVLSESADSEVRYFTKNEKVYSFCEDSLNKWRMDPTKDVNSIIHIIKENCNNIFNLRECITTLRDFIKINNIEFDESKIFQEIKDEIDADSAYNIITILKESNISNANNIIDNMTMIWEAENSDISYFDNETEDQISSSDIKKVDLDNLIRDSQRVGEFLDKVEEDSKKKWPIKKILKDGPCDINESNMINYVDDNGYINIRLRSYLYEGDIREINSTLKSCVSCMNNILYNHKSHCYYSLHEDYFNFGIRSNYKVILSVDEDANRNFTNTEKEIMCDLYTYTNILEEISSGVHEVMNELDDSSLAAFIEPSTASVIFEVLGPYSGLENGFLEEFIRLCDFEANPRYETIKEEYDNTLVEFDLFENHTERLNYALTLIKEAKESNKKEKGIKSINDMRLAWAGVKSKLKHSSSKVQELGRDLDVEYNNLCKTLSNAFTVDHRQEIITGQVNRSLSKTISLAIPLAIAGGVAGKSLAAAAITPIIAGIAAFALSKNTSTKEKKLIIDEIDIELKVLDREINKAESEGSTKAYRDLLTIQKNLQRKRQEIYYGLAKRGKRIPIDSTIGLKK